MKLMAITLAGTMLALGMARAETASSPAAPSTSKTDNVCLVTYQIDHTTTPDDDTIVFHMTDGKTWTNKLANHCSGLKFNGFAYDVRGPNQICGNLQSIRVLKTGAVCLLGPFTPGEPKPSPTPAP